MMRIWATRGFGLLEDTVEGLKPSRDAKPIIASICVLDLDVTIVIHICFDIDSNTLWSGSPQGFQK